MNKRTPKEEAIWERIQQEDREATNTPQDSQKPEGEKYWEKTMHCSRCEQETLHKLGGQWSGSLVWCCDRCGLASTPKAEQVEKPGKNWCNVPPATPDSAGEPDVFKRLANILTHDSTTPGSYVSVSLFEIGEILTTIRTLEAENARLEQEIAHATELLEDGTDDDGKLETRVLR